MRSNVHAESPELDLDFPATDEDIVAQERARSLNGMSPQAYLHFLLTFAPFHPAGRELPPRDEQFRL